MKRLQCKDIPDAPILDLVEEFGRRVVWGNWFPEVFEATGTLNPSSIRPAFPPNTPEKLIRAKMNSLMRKGLIEGCPCGCRGDYRPVTPRKSIFDQILAQNS